MDETMMYGRRIPEYYDTMYLDGYTPYEILHATSRKMYNDYLARKEEAQRAKEEAEMAAFIPTIHFKTTVKIK